MYQGSNKPQSEMTALPGKYPQGKFREKSCRKCDALFKPQAPSHLYCSQDCADIAHNDRYLERTYGIDWKHYLGLLEEQNNVCAICFEPGWVMAEHHKMLLVVDHCHKSGEVRGLLCHNCNRGIGLLQDSTKILKSSIEYLEGATTIPKGSTLK